MRPFLLCTDLDRTLIPNGVQPESPVAASLFQQLANRPEVTLAYVTGRHRALVEQAVFDFDLPAPDFVIADVGTTIYHVNASGWNHCEIWDAQIAPDWQGRSNDELHLQLSVFPMLRLQEDEKQNRHKLSYYAPLETDVKELSDEIDKRLKYAGIKANLIWSLDEADELCLLDVLPASANKLHAIRFLMQESGFRRDAAVFAGDSGNDLDVLMSDIRAVLVANAGAAVRSHAAGANMDNLYIAKGGYLGMNGNYSAGILEGVAHYFPDVDAWLHDQI